MSPKVKPLKVKRKTVGAIARENSQKKGTFLIGDLAADSAIAFAEGLDDAISKGRSNFPNVKRFYITMFERKHDLLPNTLSICRRFSSIRPYPEALTDVFRHDTEQRRTFFCWSIPHAIFHNDILTYPCLYDDYTVRVVKAWRSFDMDYFGFLSKKNAIAIKQKDDFPNDVDLEDRSKMQHLNR